MPITLPEITITFITLLCVIYLSLRLRKYLIRSTTISKASLLIFKLFFLSWLSYGIINNELAIILNSIILCVASLTNSLWYLKSPKAQKIDHIGVWTENIEEMRLFYTQNFDVSCGDKYYNPQKQFTSYFLSFPSGARIELMHSPDNHSQAKFKNHIAIALGSNVLVDKTTKKLSASGVSIVGEPRTTGDGYYESLIQDIEGNLIELTV